MIEWVQHRGSQCEIWPCVKETVGTNQDTKSNTLLLKYKSPFHMATIKVYVVESSNLGKLNWNLTGGQCGKNVSRYYVELNLKGDQECSGFEPSSQQGPLSLEFACSPRKLWVFSGVLEPSRQLRVAHRCECEHEWLSLCVSSLIDVWRVWVGCQLSHNFSWDQPPQPFKGSAGTANDP